MYWKWMQENNKSVYEASEHFGVSVQEIWKGIENDRANEMQQSKQ